MSLDWWFLKILHLAGLKHLLDPVLDDQRSTNFDSKVSSLMFRLHLKIARVGTLEKAVLKKDYYSKYP